MRRRSHGRRVGGPRSWRTRSDVAMRATGWTRAEVQGRILKGLYSAVGPTPKWARLAYDRGWITLAAFLRCTVCGVPEHIACSRSVTSHRRCNVVVCNSKLSPRFIMP